MIPGLKLALTLVGQPGDRCQNLIRPFQQVGLRQLERIDVFPPGLVDRKPDPLDIKQVSECIQRSERVTFQLTVPGSILARRADQASDPVLEIRDVQQVVRHNQGIRRAEPVLYPFGEIHGLFNADHRIGAQGFGFFHLTQYEGSVAFGGFPHLCVIPCQVFGRILHISAQPFLKQVLAELVRVRSLLRVGTSLVFFLCAQLRGWRAVEPSVTCGSG